MLFELRYPTRWYTKLLSVILVLAFFTVLATATIAGYLLYRIVKPQRTSPEINMDSFPGRPDAVNFIVPGTGQREGWFFPGLRGAPVILLCHGYQSSRGELLTLVSALQDHQYNVFVFDFSAHGKNPGKTSFGLRETAELRAAIDSMAQRNDVDATRFGIWGYNLGAYTATSVAENDKRIRALVLDSIYDDPSQMIKLQVERTGLGGFPLMVKSAQIGFGWLNSKVRNAPPLSKGAAKLAGVPKLFIEATDDPQLADYTRELFLNMPGPREQVIIPHGNLASLDEEDRRDYENRVVGFFLLNMPPTGKPAS